MNKGQIMTQEQKDKIRKSMAGKVLTREHRLKLSVSHTGLKKSEASKQKQSDATHGSNHGCAKLNEELVWQMRFGSMSHLTVKLTKLVLEEIYNIKVTVTTIADIINKPETTWKRVVK